MKLEDKYPDGYFEHWLIMLSTMNAELSKNGFEEQITHYLNFEGEEEMKKLRNEVVQIVQSDDLMKFKEVGNHFDIEDLNELNLKTMAEVIMNWN